MQLIDKSELVRIAGRPAIAFATAALEKALPVAKGASDVEHVLRAMIDELWAYQRDDLPRAEAALTEAEARALPSARFYFTYQARLLDLIGSGQPRSRALHDLLGAAIALISFIVYVMHHEERRRYPRKPLVLGNDIAEVTSETFEIGLATLVKASADPDAVLAWQRKNVVKLVAAHPASRAPDDFGSRLQRAYFFSDN